MDHHGNHLDPDEEGGDKHSWVEQDGVHVRDGEKHPDNQKASNVNGGKGDKDLLCQGVFKIIPDFLKGQQVDYVIAVHEYDDRGQADSDRVLQLLVQDEGKPEVCEDVKGGGEESKDEVAEEVVPADYDSGYWILL